MKDIDSRIKFVKKLIDFNRLTDEVLNFNLCTQVIKDEKKYLKYNTNSTYEDIDNCLLRLRQFLLFGKDDKLVFNKIYTDINELKDIKNVNHNKKNIRKMIDEFEKYYNSKSLLNVIVKDDKIRMEIHSLDESSDNPKSEYLNKDWLNIYLYGTKFHCQYKTLKYLSRRDYHLLMINDDIRSTFYKNRIGYITFLLFITAEVISNNIKDILIQLEVEWPEVFTRLANYDKKEIQKYKKLI
ncbi:MAG TPA: hypothetical protein PK718_05430 [Candidatus Methanofastidiosa archaeon]|nr:hypothetical protein [Candidatus Methanofastidiosa archaeon]